MMLINMLLSAGKGIVQSQQPNDQNKGKPQKPITDEEKKLLGQIMNDTEREVNTFVSLNPAKAFYWETLAMAYESFLDYMQINPPEKQDTATNIQKNIVLAYQRAIQLDSQNSTLYFALGRHLFSTGNYLGAYASLNQSIQYKQNWWQNHYFMGLLFNKIKENQGALDEMQAALKLIDPKEKETVKFITQKVAEYQKLLKTQQEQQKQQQQQQSQQPATEQQQPSLEQQLPTE